MNKDQAKLIVDKELSQTKYTLMYENDVFGIKGYIGCTVALGLVSLPLMEKSPILTCAGVLVLGAVFNKGIDHSQQKFKKDKQIIKNDYYSKKVLKHYQKQLNQGQNPLEDIPFNEDDFETKIQVDVNNKKLRKIK